MDYNRIYEFWNIMGDEETRRKFKLTLDELKIIIGQD